MRTDDAFDEFWVEMSDFAEANDLEEAAAEEVEEAPLRED